jgi:hypothetical protein
MAGKSLRKRVLTKGWGSPEWVPEAAGKSSFSEDGKAEESGRGSGNCGETSVRGGRRGSREDLREVE